MFRLTCNTLKFVEKLLHTYNASFKRIFITILSTVYFDCHWSSSGGLKIVLWRLLCLSSLSNAGCVATSHIRVFRGAVCLLLPRCVFRPRV
jgi:hypothetical protein